MTNKPRKWTTGRIARAVLVGTALLSAGYILWMAFGPPPRFPIPKDTTRFTTPLLSDGSAVDFNAAAWEAYGWPTETTKSDTWDKLFDDNSPHAIKYTPLNYNPAAPGGFNRDIKRRTTPFSTEEDAEYAEVILGNERFSSVAEIQTATRRFRLC